MLYLSVQKTIPIRTKLRLFNYNVLSVVVYDCETWSTKKPEWLYYIPSLVPKTPAEDQMDRLRNEELWESTQQVPGELRLAADDGSG